MSLDDATNSQNHEIESVRFLETCFEPAEWVALLLKNYLNNRVAQRIGSRSWATHSRTQKWLKGMNGLGFNVYVGVNALKSHRRSRSRDSIGAVRHVFLEADRDGAAVLASIEVRTDVPPPSYILYSSPNRIHFFWRASNFEPGYVERLQKMLAAEIGTDPAATSIAQTTRLPGFLNHKYNPPPLVTVEYRDSARSFTPHDFPIPPDPAPPSRTSSNVPGRNRDRWSRSHRYLARVPPAIAGQHGDLQTFRTCCRLVRGFGLDDDEAFAVLGDWNVRCQPPWTEQELRAKIRAARRYGREPIGGLL
jgi:hypothetical protein